MNNTSGTCCCKSRLKTNSNWLIIIIIIIIVIITEAKQHTTGACSALTQVDYTHRHNEAANIVNKEFAIKCGLSKEKPTPY